MPDPFAQERVCRGCGYTDAQACPGGCAWTIIDLFTPTAVCSRCAEELDWSADYLQAVGRQARSTAGLLLY